LDFLTIIKVFLSILKSNQIDRAKTFEG